MRNKLVAAAITGLVAAPGAHAAADVSWFGFNQITAFTTSEQPNGDGGSLAFGADRIRIGYKAKFDNGAFSKLQVDFNRPAATRGGLNRIIKDAVVGYDFGPANIQLGNRKIPLGMDFTTSGKKLDIVNRGMEKHFVLERSAGAMLSGDAGPIGYNLWVGNPAHRSGLGVNRSGGTDANAVGGEDYSYAARVSYGMGKMLNAQLAYGASTASVDGGGVTDPEDYNVTDIGLQSQPMPGLTLKAEYLMASNVGHVEDRDQTVWFAHGGYEFTPMVEGVVRHYSSNAEFSGGSDETVSETYVGANIFLNPEKHHEARIQLNYILPSGDSDAGDFTPGAHRFGTVTDDAGDRTGTFKAMFQTAF